MMCYCGFVLGPCFVCSTQCSFYFCNQFAEREGKRERKGESWLFYFNCLPDVTWLFVLNVSS